MSTTLTASTGPSLCGPCGAAWNPALQALWILRIGFSVAPIPAWLFGIIVNLLLIPGHFDTGLRDLAPQPNSNNAAHGEFHPNRQWVVGVTPLVLTQPDQVSPNDPDGGWNGPFLQTYALFGDNTATAMASFDQNTDHGASFEFFNNDVSLPALGSRSPAAKAITVNAIPSPIGGTALLLGYFATRRRCRAA